MTAVDATEAEAGLFAGDSEMALRCRALDWAATPLGPVRAWPAALRTAVRLMLASPIATSLWCGPAYTLIYNDAYRRILGAKHPKALGRSGAEVWNELWAALESQFAGVRGGGPAVFADEALLTMERLEGGAGEDAWFTYALSALLDEGGVCLAVHNVAVEITERVRARQALASERARLFEAFQRVPSFVSVVTGADHILEYANEAYLRFVGRRDIVGRPVWEALPDARGQGFEALLDGVRDTGVPVVGREAPLWLVRTPGQPAEERFVDYVYEPLSDASGARWGVMGYGSDVTDHVLARREVERLLEETAAALRTADAERARAEGILDAMTDAYFTIDASFRFVAVNAAMERAGKQSRAELLGRTLWDCFPGSSGTVFETHYRRAVVDREESHFTHSYRDEQFDIVVDVDVYPAVDGGAAVFWRNFTRRAQEDALLRARETQLRTLADAIPTLAWTARADGYRDWFNARWFEYTGATLEQMQGWGWQAVHDPRVLPAVMEIWRIALATGEPAEMTVPLRGADGRFRRFLTRLTPLRGEGGEVIRWFGTNTDVEAERLAREAAERANQAKMDFLATMSHELRTPLNAIAGYAELIDIGIHGPVTEAQHEALSRIQRSGRHLLGLINDVLNFAKLEAGHVEFTIVDVELPVATSALEPLVEPQLRAKSLHFERGDCAEAHVVRADRDKLQQILINLLSNAIKFTPAGGTITLRCEEAGDMVRVTVADTGIGIAAHRLDEVFAPFVQVDRRLTTAHEGTGLGLAISRDLARAMAGDLTVVSTLGAGSTFILALPRASRSAADRAATATPPTPDFPEP